MLEDKLGRSVVHSKEILWAELQKTWENINVEVQTDEMLSCRRWMNQIIKVDKNVRIFKVTVYIWQYIHLCGLFESVISYLLSIKTGMGFHCVCCRWQMWQMFAFDDQMRCRGVVWLDHCRDLMNLGSCQLLQGALLMLSLALFKESDQRESLQPSCFQSALITGPWLS